MTDKLATILSWVLGTDLLLVVGASVAIMAVYFVKSFRGTPEHRRKYQHVTAMAASFILMLVLTVFALIWDLYFRHDAVNAFPLWLRWTLTIPAIILCNWALYMMGGYQFIALYKEQHGNKHGNQQ